MLNEKIFDLELELCDLDQQWTKELESDNISRYKLKELSNSIDDTYDKLLDEYQYEINSLIDDETNIDEDFKEHLLSKYLNRMMEITAIMFE